MAKTRVDLLRSLNVEGETETGQLKVLLNSGSAFVASKEIVLLENVIKRAVRCSKLGIQEEESFALAQAKKVMNRPPRERLAYLKLARGIAVEETKKGTDVKKLLFLPSKAFTVLTSFEYVPSKARKAAIETFCDILKACPQSLPDLLTATEKAVAEKRKDEAIMLLRVINALVEDKQGRELVSDDVSCKALKIATAAAMRHGGELSRAMADGAGAYFGTLTSSNLEEHFMPQVGRSLLREKETALAALPYLLENVTVDLSPFAQKTLLPALTASIESTKEIHKESALSLARILAQKSKSEEGLKAVGLGLAAILRAKTTTATGRASTSKCLTAFLQESLALKASLASFIDEVIKTLATWLGGKETNEEARAFGCESIVYASAIKEGELPKEVLPIITPVLERKKSDLELSATLRALAACNEFDLIAADSKIADTIGNFPKGKKVTRGDASNALLVLMKLYSKSGTATAPGVEAGIKLCKDVDAGPVYSKWSISKMISLSDDDLISIANVSSKLIEEAEGRAIAGVKLHACSALSQLCVCSSKKVARKAQELASKLSKNSATASKELLHGFWNSELNGTEGYSSLLQEWSIENVGEFGTAALACAGERDTSVIPILLLITHHPKLLWEGEQRFFRPHAKGFLPETDWLEDACTILLGENGFRSADKNLIHCAGRALTTLLSMQSIDVSRIFKLVLPQIRELLEASESVNLSDEVVEVYCSSVASFEKETGGESGESTAETKTTTTAKRKAPKGDSARDKQALQAEKDKKKAAEEAERVKKEKEAELKQGLQEARNVFMNVFSGLVGLGAFFSSKLSGSSAQQLSYKEIPSLVPSVLVASGWRVEEQLCRDVLVSMAASAEHRAASLAHFLAASLYDLSTTKKAGLAHQSLTNLAKAVPPPFEAETFSLILPLLESVLLNTDSADPDTTSMAFDLMEIHVTGDAFPTAVQLANSGAASWMLKWLMVDDSGHLFTRAMNVLGDLSETAISLSQNLPSLLAGLRCGKVSVREATLEALERIPELASGKCQKHSELGRHLWLAKHDVDEELAAVAESLWERYGHPLDVAEDSLFLTKLVTDGDKEIRVMSSRSLAHVLVGENYSSERNVIVAKLFKSYLESLPKEEDEANNMMVRRTREKPAKQDLNWTKREGVATALKEFADQGALSMKDVPLVFTFLAARGLGDVNDGVRSTMANASVSVVHCAGAMSPTLLLPMIESQLQREPLKDEAQEVLLHIDRTHENLIVSLGTVASYLPAEKQDKMAEIAVLIMKTAMNSKSESVQRACSKCVSALAKSLVKDEETHIKFIFGELFGDGDFCRRRGAAYALSGLTSGNGLRGMKRLKLFQEIKDKLSGKTQAQKKQSALFLVETLALSFENLFEPYFVTIIPFLLQSMGDTADVRQACWQAAKSLMATLSAHGVRQVLPSMMEGLKDRNWRTKAGSADLLGAMAFCAPRQLAHSLPLIVPRLAAALADAHPKVVEAAEAAVSRIAAVTSNPEVRSLSPFLLAALRDPAGKTSGAIDAMLQTEFVHAVDAASLSLLIPPLHRALRERSNELKKRAAAIVGSMCDHANNPTDVVPYLDLLLPDLREVLLDPIPDVRKTSASALGSLAAGLGADSLPGLVDWLQTTLLNGSYSTAERSGAALGLAAVSVALSEIRINSVIQKTLSASNTLRTPSEVIAAKEGGLLLLSALPGALKERFEVRLSTALPQVLKGLADEADNVREAALGAGRAIVAEFGRSSLDRLLPLLCDGMQDTFWRIRQNSTQLLGDLLLALAGAKATADGTVVVESEDDEDAEEKEGEEEDEDSESDELTGVAVNVSPAEVMNVMTSALGVERRNEVIATLYLARNDVSSRVRLTAVQVWKMVIFNTPRTLREILPQATQQIITGLSSPDEERVATAARALGDLGQKLGDHVLPQVLPLLKEGLSSDNDRLRRGACEGLAELVSSATKYQLQEHAETLLPAVEIGLCDDLETVRAASADVFASLGKPLGHATCETVVQRLVKRAADFELEKDEDDPEAENAALDGLEKVLAVSGNKILTTVITSVTDTVPMTGTDMLTIAAAARVAPSYFEVHLKEVIASIVDTFIASKDTLADDQIEGTAGIFSSVASAGDEITKSLLVEVLSPLSHNVEMRIAGAKLLGIYVKALGNAVIPHAGTILEALIRQLADVDTSAVQEAGNSLNIMGQVIAPRELINEIGQLRQSLRLAASYSTYRASDGLEGDRIEGLCIPKGPAPLVPIMTEGLLHGTPELREQAALAISELVELSEQATMSPFVVKLTGPLIRVISDRFPWQVKAAILQALLSLLQRCSTKLKMLIPQLQSIFIKNLADPTRTVRKRALAAMGELIKIHQRPEPVINDMVSFCTKEEHLAGARASVVEALGLICENAPKFPASSLVSVPDALITCATDDQKEIREVAAPALASFSKKLPSSAETGELVNRLAVTSDDGDSAQHGLLLAIGEVLRRNSADQLVRGDIEGALDLTSLQEILMRNLKSGETFLRDVALATSSELYIVHPEEYIVNAILETITTDPSVEVRGAGLRAAGRIGNSSQIPVKSLIAAIVAAGGQRNTIIKYNADKAIRGMFIGANGAERDGTFDDAREVLSEEKSEWLWEKISKLQTVPESDEE